MESSSNKAATPPRGQIESASGRVFLNFLAVGSGEVIARLLAFGWMLYVARNLGVAGYGIIAFVSGVTLYLAKLADFGIEAIGTGEIAQHRHHVDRFGSSILSMRLTITLCLTAVAVFLAQLSLEDPERTVTSVYFLTLIPIAASTKWIHVGLEAARPVGLWRIIGETVTLILVVAFVQNTSHLWRIPAAVLAGEALVAIALWWLLFRQGHAVSLRWDPATAVPVFRRAGPVVAQVILGLLLYNVNLLFLRFMQSSEAVGFYGAANTLISFLANLCTAYGMTLLPTLARLGRRSIEERNLYHTALAQIFAVALPVTVGGTFLAHRIISLGFGQDYAPSSPILQVLVWVILPYAFHIVSWSALIAHGHQALVLRASIYSVVANVILSLVLIDSYGGVGAAIATVAAEFLASGLTVYYAVRKGLPVAPHTRFWRPIVAAAAMSVALWAVGDVHLLVQLTVGAMAYALALLFVGGIEIRRGVPALAV